MDMILKHLAVKFSIFFIYLLNYPCVFNCQIHFQLKIDCELIKKTAQFFVTEEIEYLNISVYFILLFVELV